MFCRNHSDTDDDTSESASSKLQSTGPINKKRWYKQHFKSEWSSKFKWAEKRGDSAYCTVCQCRVNNNLTQIERHAKTKKHLTNESSIRLVQPINTSFVSKDGQSKLERMAVMFLVEHNVPFTCSDHLTQIIKYAGKNPKAAEQMKCSRTKATQMVLTKFCPEQKLWQTFCDTSASPLLWTRRPTSHQKSVWP